MPFRSFLDQLKDAVTVSFPPTRIISLVPSQTELLHDLGLNAEVVGITRYCVHPRQWDSQKAIIGGTKKFNFEIIEKLAPDLIIGNKEENYQAGIAALKIKYPVWMSDIATLPEAFSMIVALGEITDRKEKAEYLVNRIEQTFDTIRRCPPVSVLYLIWRKPWMAAASMTFIDTMLRMLGLQNVANQRVRYPELTDADIRNLKPDLIFLSTEPFPFQEIHIEELRLLCPSSRIILVDGEMFSWYGSRMLKAPAYFNSLNLG